MGFWGKGVCLFFFLEKGTTNGNVSCAWIKEISALAGLRVSRVADFHWFW